MLKATYDTLEEIPEALRSHYEKGGDGKYRIKIEGMVMKERLDEFRNNNTELQRKLDVFRDVDVAEYTRLKQIETDLEAGKIEGKTADILEKRTAEMKKAHEKALNEATIARDTATAELSRLKIVDAAVTEAAKLGLRPTAKDDLAARVAGVFKLKEGKVIGFGLDGKELYGPTSELLTIGEYVAGLTKSADHLFDPSAGTGAGGGGEAGKGGGHTGANPWKKETWNLTQQGQIFKADPKKARELAKQAGKSLPE